MNNDNIARLLGSEQNINRSDDTQTAQMTVCRLIVDFF